MEPQKIPLISGMYQSRSIIASAQRCVNLYPERNASDAPFPYTNQLTPGLVRMIAPTGQPHRCLYTASNNSLYEVIGSSVYSVGSGFTRTLLGTIGTGTTPVSMADNGLAVIIVDGTSNGYCINLADNTFGTIIGQNGAFYGGTRVDYQDTFFVLNRPGTNQWYCSLSNVTYANLRGTVSPGATAAAFDPLDIASKTGNPDPIQAVIVMHREEWLIGTETSEVWYNAGNAQFPFTILPGVFIEHGCIAPYSICKQDLTTYWLGKDRQGTRIVLCGNQYAAKRISTHAIEQQFSSYATVEDAIGFTYQQVGHTFLVLTFPTANVTWVYDIAEDLWHERTWTDDDGNENRIRPSTCTAYNQTVLVGDWENGALYAWRLTALTDNGQEIVRRRGWPDIQIHNQRVEHSRLVIDMGVGEGLPDGSSSLVSMRYSDDRGKTWGNPITYGLGAAGDYEVSVLFTQLGQARNRVYELFWSGETITALNGGDVWLQPSET